MSIELPIRSKRFNMHSGLTSLPNEILDIILSYIIPQTSSIAATAHPKGILHVFAAPILQTSRRIRGQGLGMINRRAIWVRLELTNYNIQYMFENILPTLSCVPDKLQHLIPHTRREVVLKFTSTWKSAYCLSDKVPEISIHTLPLNLTTMLQICNTAASVAQSFGTIKRAKVDFEGMTDVSWTQVSQSLFPGLSTLFKIPQVELSRYHMRCLGVRSIGSPDPYYHEYAWKLVNTWKQATDVITRANDLERAGCFDEAGYLLLSEGQLFFDIGHILPSPPDWRMGEIDIWRPRAGRTDIILTPGKCPVGNALRDTVCQIICRASLAYASFLSKYGVDWCSKQEWGRLVNPFTLLPDLSRFLEEPCYTWFGVSQVQRARIHYSRGVLREAIHQIEKSKVSRGIVYRKEFSDVSGHVDGSTMEDFRIAKEMYLAHRLQPDNDSFCQAYNHFARRCYKTPRAAANALEPCLLVYDVATTSPETKFQWIGDRDMFYDSWRGCFSQYLPLASKMPAETLKELLYRFFPKTFVEPADENQPEAKH